MSDDSFEISSIPESENMNNPLQNMTSDSHLYQLPDQISTNFQANSDPNLHMRMRIYDLQTLDNTSDDANYLQSEHTVVLLDKSNYINNNVPMEQTRENQVETRNVQDLKDLLKSWNQDVLLDTFIAEKVFIPELKILKLHHIERLLQKYDIGTQINFEHNLEQWRQSIGINSLSIPYYLRANNVESSPSSSAMSSPSMESRMSAQEVHFHPYSTSPNEPNECNICLSDILNETPKGKVLAEYYNKYSKFQEEQRTALVNLLAQFFDERGIQLTLSATYRLENEILATFPTEKLEYYRSGRRGRIYTKYYNLKTTFNSALCKRIEDKSWEKCPKKYRPEKNFEPEEDADVCLRALKFDNLTADQFDCTWKACSQYRLQDLKKLNTAEIMDKWPFYRNPSGFRLIDIDFNIAYKNGDGLTNNWQNYVEKLITFLCNDSHVKDKTVKTLIEQLKCKTDIPENSQNAILFLAIHGYLVPTTRTVKKDTNGKKKITKYTIKDSQESVLFVGKCLQEVEDHINHLSQTKSHIQPFIYIIGNDLFSIQEIYIYFDNIRYKQFNVLRAIDICFKIFYVFNLDFPQESVMFYALLESCFYNLKSQNTFAKVSILSEYLNKK